MHRFACSVTSKLPDNIKFINNTAKEILHHDPPFSFNGDTVIPFDQQWLLAVIRSYHPEWLPWLTQRASASGWTLGSILSNLDDCFRYELTPQVGSHIQRILMLCCHAAAVLKEGTKTQQSSEMLETVG
jgi:hypothetical protein